MADRQGRAPGDEPPDEGPDDPSADTGAFRAFANRDEPVERGGAPVGVPFRLLTLLGGLAVFVLIVWLLLR